MNRKYHITIIVLLLAIALIFTLVGCSSKEAVDEIDEVVIENDDTPLAETTGVKSNVNYVNSSSNQQPTSTPAPSNAANNANTNNSNNDKANDATNEKNDKTDETQPSTNKPNMSDYITDGIKDMKEEVDNALNQYKSDKFESTIGSISSAFENGMGSLGGYIK